MSAPIIHVYLKTFPFLCDEEIIPESRKNLINRCKSEKVRNEKYYAWKLLQEAMYLTFSLNMKDVQFHKDRHGKWTCPDCYFSITHSNGVAAVVVANEPVGIDLEKVDLTRDYQKIASKAFLIVEKKDLTVDKFFKIWTIKEAYYKSLEKQTRGFIPHDFNTIKIDHVLTKAIKIKDEKYYLSIVCEHTKDIKFQCELNNL